jgi:hypothetical protein
MQIVLITSVNVSIKDINTNMLTAAVRVSVRLTWLDPRLVIDGIRTGRPLPANLWIPRLRSVRTFLLQPWCTFDSKWQKNCRKLAKTATRDLHDVACVVKSVNCWMVAVTPAL